jgi:hypothetical protein
MLMPSRHIFLSFVLDEFRTTREKLARTLRMPEIDVHVVGDGIGYVPPHAAVEEMLNHCSGLIGKFPVLKRRAKAVLAMCGKVSITLRVMLERLTSHGV